MAKTTDDRIRQLMRDALTDASSAERLKQERQRAGLEAQLLDDVGVTLAVEDQGSSKRRRFRMTGYTGALVTRWWGQMGIDVSGMECQEKVAILLGHDDSQIAGFATSVDKSKGRLELEGLISSSTDAGREVAALSDEGFPWQASVGVIPLSIEELAAGAESELNGKKVTGPLSIWRKSRLTEVSFVVAGADKSTSAEVMKASPGGKHVEKTETLGAGLAPLAATLAMLSVAELSAANPDLVLVLRNEGRASAREELKDLLSELPEAEAVAAFVSGKNKTEALAEVGRRALADAKKPPEKKRPGDELREKHGLPGVAFSGRDREAAGGDEAQAEDLSELPIEERANLEFERDPSLRAEFGTEKAYAAWLRYEAKQDEREDRAVSRVRGR